MTETQEAIETPVKELIHQTKAAIKEKAEEQKAEKRVYRSDHRLLPEGTPAYRLQWSLQARAAEITRLLVYYHQLRETGKQSSHFYRD